MATIRGIPLSKVSPAFLHANSTSHTWVFSAFAELIDNAYDPDVSASELLIDTIDIRGIPCLIFLDNGAGVDKDHLLKMLSFGYCEKDIYEKQGSHQPIGHYGNGFKSGSMRIGKDALVFTRCQKSASIGFLSQTYLAAVHADSVVVPILDYRLPNLERIKSQESRNNLNAILEYSVFKSEDELKDELKALEGSKTGTKIIISNLKRLQDRTYELDFVSDPYDIRCPEAHEIDATSVYNRPIQHSASEYKRSLREYCSILFLRPRMKITIRGVRVKSKLVSKSLSKTEIDMYKPSWLSRPVKIIFGFTCEKGRAEDYDFGMMLYHRNRLIKAFEKIGYQKQPNGLGVGVVGVAQVDFLQPIHNKQDFNKDEKFNSVMAAFALKLNDYWNEKKGSNGFSTDHSNRNLPDWLWAQCDHCLKWRRLPDVVDPDSLPDLWYCRMNPDATHNRCDIPEEPEDEDLAIKPTYEKTFKKKLEERKRLQVMEREREEQAKRRKIMEKEQELKQKEAALRAIQQVAAAQPENRAVTSLQKALAEARRKEEQQKRLILQIQEQKKHMEEQRNSLLKMAANLQTADSNDRKDVLERMSKLISSFNSNLQPSPLLLSNKKKSEVEGAAKSGKKICIKTETGEMLSVTQNDVDSDNNYNNRSSASLPRKQIASKSRENSSAIKTETPVPAPIDSDGVDLGELNFVSMQQTALKAPTPLKLNAAADKAPKTKRKRPEKGTVLAVIDLTSESEFGELVDVKPDLEGLRASLQDNLQQDVDLKPDKEALDDAMAVRDDPRKEKQGEVHLPEAKQELPEPSSHNVAATPYKKGLDLNNSRGEFTNNKAKSSFGPSESEPELLVNTTENFQENLETAMAAIQKRMEKEKKQKQNRDVKSIMTPVINMTTDDKSHERESLEEIKTENFTAPMLTEHLEVESPLKVITETSIVDLKVVENDMDKIRVVKDKENSTIGFLSRDDDDDYSDFDWPIDDDDSDYRDHSTLYDKGDLGESYIGRRKCHGTDSRNNSIEDVGGSANLDINDYGEPSSTQENTESSSDQEINRQGETRSCLDTEPNTTDCIEGKDNFEIQDNNESHSSKNLTVAEENISLDQIHKTSQTNFAKNVEGVSQNFLPTDKENVAVNHLCKTTETSFSENVEEMIQNTPNSIESKDKCELQDKNKSNSSKRLIVEEEDITLNQIHEINFSENVGVLTTDNIFSGSADSPPNKNFACKSENVPQDRITSEESPSENSKVVSLDSQISENNLSKNIEKNSVSGLENVKNNYENVQHILQESIGHENSIAVNFERVSQDCLGNASNSVETNLLSVIPVSEKDSETNVNSMGESFQNIKPCNKPMDNQSTASIVPYSSFQHFYATHENQEEFDKQAENSKVKEMNSGQPCVSKALNCFRDEITEELQSSPNTHEVQPSIGARPVLSPVEHLFAHSSVSVSVQEDGVCVGKVVDKMSDQESGESRSKGCEDCSKHDQLTQTDLNMSALNIFSLHEHLDRGLVFSNCVDLNSKPLSVDGTLDKSFQTSDLELVFSTDDSQTEAIELKKEGSCMDASIEDIKEKLLVKSERLEEIEKKLADININIYKLLGVLVPGTELGDINNIDQIVKDMIQSHGDSILKSGSQNDNSLS